MLAAYALSDLHALRSTPDALTCPDCGGKLHTIAVGGIESRCDSCGHQVLRSIPAEPDREEAPHE